jgi:muramoyltetrapeptide carboxypeptidase
MFAKILIRLLLLMGEKDKEIIIAPYLKAGDRVALVSPAYWVPEMVIMQAAEVLREWGLQPVIGPHTTSLNVDAFSGTADERAADMLWALEDDTIKAIFCSRGGYGSMHLLNRIPLEKFRQHPKWLIGHGDITMLLYAVAATRTLCIHGPMGFQIASQQEPTTTITRNLLMGILPQYVIPGNPYNRCGHAEGILVGGNLSSYAAISGSKFQMSEDQDIILFIEEVEESLHSIDRLFYMLRLQNSFERVKGIIFGAFNSIRFDLQFGSVEQMLIAHLHDLEIPVCCGFPVGSNSCIPLVEGAPCSLSVTSENSVLTFNIEGTQQTCHIEKPEAMLMKFENPSGVRAEFKV